MSASVFLVYDSARPKEVELAEFVQASGFIVGMHGQPDYSDVDGFDQPRLYCGGASWEGIERIKYFVEKFDPLKETSVEVVLRKSPLSDCVKDCAEAETILADLKEKHPEIALEIKMAKSRYELTRVAPVAYHGMYSYLGLPAIKLLAERLPSMLNHP